MTAIDQALDDITPEGRIAGRTAGALSVGSGVAAIAVSWDDLWRRCGDELRGPCVSRSASAVLLTATGVVALALGVLAWRRVGRRPVDAYGSSRWVWALGALFALGAVLVASRVPAFTCARGRFDELLELCMHPPSTSEPSRWLLGKEAIVVAGIVGGLVIVARPRWVRVTAVLAAGLWLGGLGWTLLETMG